MPDRYCKVCAEPYDAYGIANGDMHRWEAKLFNEGAGCPCCEGVAPDDAQDRLEWAARDCLFGMGDADDAEDLIFAMGSVSPSKIEWKRPDPTVIETCGNECGIRVVECPDSGDHEVEYPRNGPHSHISDRYRSVSGVNDFQRHAEIDNVCAECRNNCDDCNAHLLDHEGGEFAPIYMPDDYRGRYPYCSDCACNHFQFRDRLGVAFSLENELNASMPEGDVYGTVTVTEDEDRFEVSVTVSNDDTGEEVEIDVQYDTQIDPVSVWAQVGMGGGE